MGIVVMTAGPLLERAFTTFKDVADRLTNMSTSPVVGDALVVGEQAFRD